MLIRKLLKYFEFSLCWLCFDAVARPVNSFRLGYPSCNSCHVSPSGGGVLSDYGSAIADEISAFSYEGMGRSDYGLFKEKSEKIGKYFNIGGNIRNLHFKNQYGDRFIPMQRDIEIALHAGEYLTLVGSYGVYGQANDYEYRRYYALINVDRHYNIRFGRFIVNYGILSPDHAAPIRRNLGFDQGSETYNGELSYQSKNYEVFATVFASEPEDKIGDDSIDEIQETGVAFKYSLFPASWVGMGLSYLYSTKDGQLRRQGGMYWYVAMEKSVLVLTEINYLSKPDPKRQMANIVSDTRVQSEHFRGVQSYFGYSLANEVNYYYSGIELFPIPHLEVEAKMIYDEIDTSYQLLTNYYF